MKFLNAFKSSYSVKAEIKSLIESIDKELSLLRPNNPTAKRLQAKIDVLEELAERLNISLK